MPQTRGEGRQNGPERGPDGEREEGRGEQDERHGKKGCRRDPFVSEVYDGDGQAYKEHEKQVCQV